MTTSCDLKAEYIKYAKCWGVNVRGLPFGTQRDDVGGDHFEFLPDGKIAIVSTDKGQETRRFESYDIDEILYDIFQSSAVAYGMQAAFEKRLAEGWAPQKTDDRRIGFPLALERIGQIRTDWRDRLEKELSGILERAAYRDEG